MQYVELVAALAVLQFVSFTMLTGRARVKFGIQAPALTGHEGFERMYRVQMNTLEILIILLPALFLASKYWPPSLVAGLGAVYLIGRIVYCLAYIRDPSKRFIGFFMSMGPAFILEVMTLVGIILSLTGAKA